MAIIDVALELPGDLARGMAKGVFTRQGGVVRRAADGAIVAHLREAGFVAQNAAASLQVGVLLVQVAGIAILERHLNRIENRIDELAAVTRLALDGIRRVERRQWMEVGEVFENALQLLKRSAVSRSVRYLEEARMRLDDCRSKVRHRVDTNPVDELVAMGQDAEWLLQLDLNCAAAELRVCQRLDQDVFRELEFVLHEHRSTFERFDNKLAQFRPVRDRLPSREMIEASPDGNPYKAVSRWRTGTEKVLAAIDQEIQVQQLLAATPPPALAEAEQKLLAFESASPLVVIRPRDVEE